MKTGAQYLEENMGLVYDYANRQAARFGHRWMIEDYVQACAEGFLKAFEHREYDPERGTVATFVYPYMRTYLQRGPQTKDAYRGFTLPKHFFEESGGEGLPVPESRPIEGGAGIHNEDEWLPEDPHAATSIEEVENRQALAEILVRLNDEHKETLIEYAACDFNLTQLGRARGISQEAARHQVGRAMRAAREIDPTLVVGEAAVTIRRSGGARRTLEEGDRL